MAWAKPTPKLAKMACSRATTAWCGSTIISPETLGSSTTPAVSSTGLFHKLESMILRSLALAADMVVVVVDSLVEGLPRSLSSLLCQPALSSRCWSAVLATPVPQAEPRRTAPGAGAGERSSSSARAFPSPPVGRCCCWVSDSWARTFAGGARWRPDPGVPGRTNLPHLAPPSPSPPARAGLSGHAWKILAGLLALNLSCCGGTMSRGSRRGETQILPCLQLRLEHRRRQRDQDADDAGDLAPGPA
jgi:hypothetical protein